jgi:hypothetical protein
MANKAKGSGMFILPDSLVTGVYLLRAYTSWMKNFFPSNCFQKEIYVYNLLADDKATITKRPSINFNKTLKPPASRITMVTDRSEKDSLKLIITADSSFIRGQRMLSIIQTNGNINYTGIHTATGQKLVISIPRTILPEGVNQITLFNEQGLPVAEKLIYTLLPPKDSFTITAKKLYKRRELVELLVNNDSKLPGVFSISVSPGTDRSCGLRNYAEIGTEFGINPEAIFKNRETESISEPFMDSLLVNATSSWINWSVILKGEKPGTGYLRERERYYISGNVAGNNEGLVFLTSPGKNAWFQYAKPDSTGDFRFSIRTDQLLPDFVLVPERFSGVSDLTIESSFPEYKIEKQQTPGIQTAIPEYIPKWSVNYQVRKLYEKNEIKTGEDSGSISDVTRFYGKPDHEIIMAEYISLPLMEEVFFEILPNVSIRKRETRKEIMIIDRVDNRPYTLIPCLMIDGVIISDPQLIIDMDPELVEKIEVVKEKYIVGKYVFPGIVNVITKKGNFEVGGNNEALRFKHDFTVERKVITGPDYEGNSKNSRIPDYRTTLFWKPTVATDTTDEPKIKFWTTDNSSGYRVRIEGFTKNGTPFSMIQTFKVQ